MRLYHEGASIEGEKILYCFGTVPQNAHQNAGRYTATMNLNGFAAVDVPVRRSWAANPNEPTEILCRTAVVSCTTKPKLPGKRRMYGAHNCWRGYLRGDAVATIRIPNRPA